MGRKLILHGTKITDTAAPVLTSVDSLESSGSLLLIDPTHPAGAWAAGAPLDGAVLPNLLEERAAALTGVTDQSLTAVRGAGWNGTDGKLERSARGGLHGILSHTTATADTDFYVRANSVAQYLLNNSGHAFYFSTWVHKTRARAAGSYAVFPEIASFASMSAPTSNYLFRLSEGTATAGTPAALKANPAAWTGSSKPTAAADTAQNFLLLGATGGMNSYSTNVTRLHSLIVYRVYLEDLTVSGRTFSEVSALDDALFTREVLTAGGRYYGDTYTDPATIA